MCVYISVRKVHNISDGDASTEGKEQGTAGEAKRSKEGQGKVMAGDERNQGREPRGRARVEEEEARDIQEG